MSALSVIESQVRSAMREAGLDVKAVAWVDRTPAGEFAAVVVRTSQDQALADEWLANQPKLMVVRSTKTRVWVALDDSPVAKDCGCLSHHGMCIRDNCPCEDCVN